VHATQRFTLPRLAPFRFVVLQYDMMLRENGIYDILSQYTFLYVANIIPFNQNIFRYNVSFSEKKDGKKKSNR